MTDILQNNQEIEANIKNCQKSENISNIDPSQVDQGQEEELEQSRSNPQLKDQVDQSNSTKSQDNAVVVQTNSVHTSAHTTENLNDLHSKIDKVLRQSVYKSTNSVEQDLHKSHVGASSHRLIISSNFYVPQTEQFQKIHHVQDIREGKYSHSLRSSAYLGQTSQSVGFKASYDQEKLNQNLASATHLPRAVQSSTLPSAVTRIYSSHEEKLTQISECLARSPLRQTLSKSGSQQNWIGFEKEKKHLVHAESSTLPRKLEITSYKNSQETSHQKRLAQISECLVRSPLRQNTRSISQHINPARDQVELRTQPFKALKVETEPTKVHLAVNHKAESESSQTESNKSKKTDNKKSYYGEVENDQESMIIDQNSNVAGHNECLAEENENQSSKGQSNEQKSKKKVTKRQEIINARKNLKGPNQEENTQETKDKKDKSDRKAEQRSLEDEVLQSKNKRRDELVQSPTKFSATHNRLFGNQQAKGGSQSN